MSPFYEQHPHFLSYDPMRAQHASRSWTMDWTDPSEQKRPLLDPYAPRRQLDLAPQDVYGYAGSHNPQPYGAQCYR